MTQEIASKLPDRWLKSLREHRENILKNRMISYLLKKSKNKIFLAGEENSIFNKLRFNVV